MIDLQNRKNKISKIQIFLPAGNSCRQFLYQENHAIVAWFRESFSGVFRNKNS